MNGHTRPRSWIPGIELDAVPGEGASVAIRRPTVRLFGVWSRTLGLPCGGSAVVRIVVATRRPWQQRCRLALDDLGDGDVWAIDVGPLVVAVRVTF